MITLQVPPFQLTPSAAAGNMRCWLAGIEIFKTPRHLAMLRGVGWRDHCCFFGVDRPVLMSTAWIVSRRVLRTRLKLAGEYCGVEPPNVADHDSRRQAAHVTRSLEQLLSGTPARDAAAILFMPRHWRLTGKHYGYLDTHSR
jgi:hypothetical protein